MSSRKLRKNGQSSGVNTPVKEDAVSLRRSSQRQIDFSPEVGEENDEMRKTKRNPRNNKKQQVVESEDEEFPLNSFDHKKHDYLNPRIKKKMSVQFEEEEIPQDDPNPFANVPFLFTFPKYNHDKQPSSPGEIKPNIDLLWMLEHVPKPYSDDEIPKEDLKQLLVAASIIKSDLVSRLTSSTNQLSINDMLKEASGCFGTLRILRDQKLKSFHGEVCKFIEGQQKLKLVAAEKENWNDSEIKTQYIKQVNLLSESTEKLMSAQNDLHRAKMRRGLFNSRKRELTAMLIKLEDELKAEEERILCLTARWNQCREDRLGVAAEVEKLGSQEEAAERFEVNNALYEAAKDEIERIKNHPLHLVAKQ